MNPRAGKTSMGSVYFKFFIFYTILWCFIVNMGDLYPQPGELKPHADGWRPVSSADRVFNFAVMTAMFYAGGMGIIWVASHFQRTLSDTLFSGDPTYRQWREAGGDPYVDALGFPLNNQSRAKRASTGPLNCYKCRTPLVGVVSAGEILSECPQCRCAWYNGQWYSAPTS